MDTETQRIINEDLAKMLNDLRRENDVVEAQVNRYTEELKKCNATMNKKQTTMDIVSKKIEKELNKTGVRLIKLRRLDRFFFSIYVSFV